MQHNRTNEQTEPKWRSARKRPLTLAFIGLALAILSVVAGPAHAQGGASGVARVRQFGRLSADAGWALIGDGLYRTANGGKTWMAISPSPGTPIAAAVFRDGQSGEALLLDGLGGSLSLARTLDGGQSWAIRSLALPDAGPAAAISAYTLQFISDQVGWIAARLASSSNFSLGVLYRTLDGGASWQRLPAPIGGAPIFIDNQRGWLAGGPTGGSLYRTVDGGVSWSAQNVGGTAARFYQLPTFTDTANGFLAVGVREKEQSRVELFVTSDSGATWKLVQQIPVTNPLSEGVVIPAEPLDSGSVLVAAPGGMLTRVSRTPAGAFSAQAAGPIAPTGATPLIVADLSVAPGRSAFALARSGDCDPATGACTIQDQLWSTTDGGQTWEPVALPAAPAAAPQTPRMLGSKGAAGHGFDKCDIADLTSMQAWRTAGPYTSVNLYIGGSQRSCANSLLNASFVLNLARQGWSFIPTWVGPQGGGNTCCSIVISSDTGTAYAQGVAEANAAADTAATLGFGATVIYYDLENYDISNSTYRSAAKSFISGWTGQLRARGHLAGVYAASCASAPIDFVTAANVPDVIWLANWYYSPPAGSYDPYATVWGVSCLGDGYWANHQRIRQYAGGHNETWGGVTFNIDSNVVDGTVATRLGSPGAPVILSPPTNTAFAGIVFNVVLQGGAVNETGVADYEVDIATDPAFTNLVFHIQNQVSATIPVNVPQPGSYWIRARQGDRCCTSGAYSAVTQITTTSGPSRLP